MHVREVIDYCNTLLEADRFADSSYNGLQVEGQRPVRRVAWCVTACAASLERAAAHGADLVLCHHGLFWQGQSPLLVGALGKRVRVLMEHGLSLAAYHLPLDAHPELGNNAQIAQAMALEGTEPWGTYRGNVIGMAGSLREPQSPQGLADRLGELVDHPVLHLPGGPAEIRRVAVVSGGAASMAVDAARAGCHAFVTGEPTESVTHVAAEEGIHVFACGHHATEVFGVRALAARLGEHFGLEVVSADTPNPV